MTVFKKIFFKCSNFYIFKINKNSKIISMQINIKTYYLRQFKNLYRKSTLFHEDRFKYSSKSCSKVSKILNLKAFFSST